MHTIRSVWKNAYLRKTFRFYLLTFLLPFILLSLLIMQYTSSEFEAQSLRNQMNSATYTMSHLESWHRIFGSIITQLNFNDELRKSDIRHYSGKHALQDTLHRLTAAHEGLDCIWYWVPDEKIMLSSDDSLTVMRMDRDRYAAEEKQALSISQALAQGLSLRAYDRYRSEWCVLFPYRTLNTGTSSVKETQVIFQLSEQTLTRELYNLLGDAQGVATLHSANGALLTRLKKGEMPLTDAPLPAYQSDKAQYALYGAINGDPFSGRITLSTRVEGEIWTLYCERIDPQTGMLKLQQVLVLLLAAVLSLGFLATLATAYRLYKPIHSIRNSVARSDIVLDMDEEPENDYEYIESCLEHIITGNKRLRSLLSTNTDRMRDFTLSMLLSGKIRDPAEFQRTCDFCGAKPMEAYYSIAVIQCEEESVQPLLAALNQAEQGAPLRLAQVGSQGITAFLPDADVELLPSLLQGHEARAGVSGRGTSLHQTAVHCAEAALALSEAAAGEIRAYSSLESMKTLGEILGAPSNPSIDAVTKWRSNRMEQGAWAHEDALALRLWALDVLRALPDIPADGAALFSPTAAQPDADAELLRRLKLLTQPKESEDEDTLALMRKYIKTQYDSPNFSIKSMAREFSMSISTMSNYFKKNTGTLLSDYITEMKMNKAMHLLESTSLPISEIGLAVGYYNVNSFIRRFNQINQMTPKEYRNARADLR